MSVLKKEKQMNMISYKTSADLFLARNQGVVFGTGMKYLDSEIEDFLVRNATKFVRISISLLDTGIKKNYHNAESDTHRHIIRVLKKNPMSVEELELKTGFSRITNRARISEINRYKAGKYRIEFIDRKYHLTIIPKMETVS